VADLPVFEPFRDLAFKSILSDAFKAFPKKVDQILAREGWHHFVDFMGAVERSGRVLMQFEGPPRAEMLKKSGDTALRILGIANTNAMNQLLSGAFFGVQEGNPDRNLSSKALFPIGVTTWHTFSMYVLEVALQAYAESTGGMTPMDAAKPDTLLFHGFAQETMQQAPNLEEKALKIAKAFGLPTPAHLIALSSAFWSGDLTLEDLDISIDDPGLLTEIVNRCPSNPYKGIVFSAVDNLS